jgi:outer membrane lipoprotein-sorting protein
MRSTLGILVALLIVTAVRADEPDAKAIIASAIKAAGGAEALEKHKAATWTETGTYHGMGQPLPYTGKYAMQAPHRFRMEIEGAFVIVLNDGKGWTSAGGETKEMTKEQLAAQTNDHRAGWVCSLLPLTGKEFTLKSLGESKVGDKPVVGVLATRKDFPDVKLYFDKTTHLLVQSEFTTKAAEEMFKEMTMVSSYGNYQEVAGAKIPMKIAMKRGGKVFVEAEMKDYKAVGKLDAAMFAKP